MGQRLSAECVYTIVHPEILAAAAHEGQPKTFIERKAWTTGLHLFRKAQAEGLGMPVLLGDAADCNRLLYWGLLADLTVRDKFTHYTVERVRRLRQLHAPQELILLSTRKNIAANFIRPYALCQTPEFLVAASLAA